MTSASMLGWAGEHADDEIVPRDIRFDISGNAERHWFGGDPLRTAMVDGVSILLRNVRLHAQADGIKTGFRFWSRFAWLLLV